MSCDFDRDILSAYYDRELEGAEHADARRHIAQCSDCLRELDALKRATRAMKALPPRPAPDVAPAVLREVRRLRSAWRRAMVAAAAVILACAAVLALARALPDARPIPLGRAATPPEPAPRLLTVSAPDIGGVRAEVEALLQELRVPVVVGAPEIGDTSLVKDTCLSADLTPAELDALERHLESLGAFAVPVTRDVSHAAERARVILRFVEPSSDTE